MQDQIYFRIVGCVRFERNDFALRMFTIWRQRVCVSVEDRFHNFPVLLDFPVQYTAGTHTHLSRIPFDQVKASS